MRKNIMLFRCGIKWIPFHIAVVKVVYSGFSAFRGFSHYFFSHSPEADPEITAILQTKKLRFNRLFAPDNSLKARSQT